MKNLYLSLFLFVISLVSVQAQDLARNALGVRFGDNDGFGGEISYQAQLSERTRLEIDLGYRDHVKTDAFKLTGVYQWVFYIDGGFNWFAGVGVGVGSWSYKNKLEPVDEDGLFINADGNIGIEYDFKGPVLISLDFRPEVGVVGDYGKDTDLDLALAIRFQF
jgi:hypothetical protein